MVRPVNENFDRPVLPPVDPLRSLQPAPDAVTPEAFAALLVDGDVDLAVWALRVALSGRPRADVYDTLVHDAMRLIGESWSKGRWTISEEHLASHTLGSALAAVAPMVSPADRIGPLAVVSCVTGGEHSLGLITLEHVLRDAGWSVANLRQDVPPDDLARYAARAQASLVALSAALDLELDMIAEAVAALRAMPEPPSIMVGGRLAEIANLHALGVDWTGTSLRSAQRFANEVRLRLPATDDLDA
jgi:methanogenic corrinoid protein MtbC1